MPAKKLDINFGLVSDQTLEDCMKELLDTSYEIYNYLLAKQYPAFSKDSDWFNSKN